MTDNVETGPELQDFERQMETLRASFEDEVERLSEELDLSPRDVRVMGVALLAHHLDLTRDPGTWVLVVNGSIQPYESAIEAAFGDTDFGQMYAELSRHLKGSTDG